MLARRIRYAEVRVAQPPCGTIFHAFLPIHGVYARYEMSEDRHGAMNKKAYRATERSPRAVPGARLCYAAARHTPVTAAARVGSSR